jgi:nucleotide-binding universal stress UspA family protein
MSGIVCAIRGGPACRPTVAHAIALAQQTGHSLHFLYVVNLDFLSRAGVSRSHTISEEMHQMGEFILFSAQATAAASGVVAQADVRQGNVADEIVQLCLDLDADYVVLGRPQDERGESMFTKSSLTTLTQRITDETGAQVVLAEGQCV